MSSIFADQGRYTLASKMDYCVDIAMLIDATGSMGPIIQTVKDNARNFCALFQEKMAASGKNIDQLRIKVITFRDYGYDNPAMVESPFYLLPQDNEDFKEHVDQIDVGGGGDPPESSLEALALAMQSKWTKKGYKRRHVILLFTDADAVPLGDPKRTANYQYPQNMPKDLAQLSDMWTGLSEELTSMPEQNAARLVIFAPAFDTWTDISDTWDKVWFVAQQPEGGLEGVDIDTAIDLLVNSVS